MDIMYLYHVIRHTFIAYFLCLLSIFDISLDYLRAVVEGLNHKNFKLPALIRVFDMILG